MPPAALRDSTQKSAFTIVEVMMATAIMALVIATAVTTLQRGFLSVAGARGIAVAGQILQTEFENIRLSDWSTVDAYAAGPTTLTIPTAYTSLPTVGARYTLTRTTATPMADMKSITLTVTWTTMEGRSLTRSQTTYYGRYGLFDFFYNNG